MLKTTPCPTIRQHNLFTNNVAKKLLFFAAVWVFAAPPSVYSQDASKQGGSPVTLTLENSTFSNLEFDWLGFDGTVQPQQVLQPGQKQTINSHSGHVWQVMSNNAVVAKYVVNTDTEQRFQVMEGRSLGGSPSVTVLFKNISPQVLDVYWVDFDGNERLYGQIAPGKTWNQLTGVAHLWHFKRDGMIVSRYMANENESQTFDIDYTEPKLVKRGWLEGIIGAIPIVNVIYVTVAYGHHGPVVATVEAVPHYQTIALLAQYRDENKPGNTVWCSFGSCGAITQYLNESERKQYLIYVKNDKLYDAKGAVFDTSNASRFHGHPRRAIFVMDAEGRIYASNTPKVTAFHHSSFLAGQPVAAAGEIEVIGGKLKLISNHSGHYRPPGDLVDQALNELRRAGYPEAELKNVTKQYMQSRATAQRVDNVNDKSEL